MSEQRRGCGYRKIGGLYLVSSPGITLVCDGLPMPLERCGCCGFVPPFSRNLQHIHPQYIIQAEIKLHQPEKSDFEEFDCSCADMCPVCNAKAWEIQGFNYGLMFVGSQYTPSSFIKEAELQGVSKRIPEIPNWLKLGETWILLAHNKVPKDVTLKTLKENTMLMKEPKTCRAVFYAFKPERVEMPVWKGSVSNADIQEFEKHGITPVLLEDTPENRKRHKDAHKDNAASLLQRWNKEQETEEN